MSPASTALVIGEALVDIVRTDGDPTHHPGGSCANVAVALGRLGRRTELATRYGDDRLGDILEAHLTGSGVEIRPGSRRTGARTSSAEADLGPDGSATYRFDVSWDVEVGRILPGCSVIHIGSIGTQLAPGAEVVERTVQAARATATISYDVNARPALFGSRPESVERVSRLVAASDIAKASDEDLAWLYPEQSVEAASAAWLDLGAAAVLVTRGASGASVFTRGGRADVERAPVHVVDTIGAGDTFSAAVIDGLWSLDLLGAENRLRLHDLGLAEWRQVIEYATLVAGTVVSRPGADPPYRDELPRTASLLESCVPTGNA